ncbi:MAG TPA: MBL fold metallo-hydrolase [Candidatus Faecousia intestinigallinarum]|nr:MBL fold metallo-hydrolase [Candidatus Faecousia intestinigallinarum]
MLTFQTLVLGAYQVNCYIVWEAGSQSCVVIDPGYTPQEVLETVSRLRLTVEAILLTHAHFDHVGGVMAIQQAAGCPVYLHPADQTMPEQLLKGSPHPGESLDAWLSKKILPADIHGYQEGDVLRLAGLTFTVLSTPGHSPGSVCLLSDGHIFSGDTLFAGSCGRTDLSGGDGRQIHASLRRLAALPGDYAVHPGHGNATTLEAERQTNPYM